MFSKYWSRFWMQYAGLSRLGKIATWLAIFGTPPYYGRISLAKYNPKGYISPKATLHHSALNIGRNIFIEDGVLIFRDKNGGPVELGDAVHLHRETIIQTGHGGSVKIGSHTHIQPRCQFSAYKKPILIERRVEIAPSCAFYSYNHKMKAGEAIYNQPLQSKGGIAIEDDAWLGVGVIVLDGVRIGKGAVVGAGSVVTKDLPENSISVGVPARVVKMRNDLEKGSIEDEKRT
jgi:acetyltransferase-like isoleucine patch superfamily enzyme